MIGTRIGVYEVTAKRGEGGMGEVYQAHDAKLGRNVAIKLLPLLLTSDIDRLARFEREARVLASLNHPHIGAIYGFEDAAGVCALVLELVEGDTLAERIARGPVPATEARAIARQLTDALDAAHAKGIVHRDLKPANIKITPQGVVKVLDFGLAKAESSAGLPNAHEPTAVTVATMDGLILATTPYMSPEQARGRPVDKRTDIWAFGCVLFEMLTGRRPFAGETTPDTIAAILEREPDTTTSRWCRQGKRGPKQKRPRKERSRSTTRSHRRTPHSPWWPTSGSGTGRQRTRNSNARSRSTRDRPPHTNQDRRRRITGTRTI